MKRKKYFLMMLLMAVYMAGFAQIKTKPEGLINLPSSDYYDYFIGLGENNNAQKARELAILDVKKGISDFIYAEYQIDTESKGSFVNSQNGDSVITDITYEMNFTIKQKGKEVKIEGIREVENYSEDNKYYVLYRVPKKDVIIPKEKEKLYIYDISHKWKSVIFPGWGQMTIGKKSRGTFFLVGGGILAAGIVTSQTMYSINHSNYSSALKEGDMNAADTYKSNRDSWSTIRNISVVGFASIYIFNLIDAFTSHGNKIYSYNDRKLKIYPEATTNSIGMGLCLKLNKNIGTSTPLSDRN